MARDGSLPPAQPGTRDLEPASGGAKHADGRPPAVTVLGYCARRTGARGEPFGSAETPASPPNGLVEQFPELRQLLALRDALLALKCPRGNAPVFRRAIDSVLADDGSRERMLAELGLALGPEPDA